MPAKLLIVVALLTGCAADYNPQNARMTAQDQMRNANPKLYCPAGTVVLCDIEGGGIVGKTYSKCRCGR